MKVMCIKDPDGTIVVSSGSVPRYHPPIFIGEIYTVMLVIDSIKFRGTNSYILEERPEYCSYNCRYFSPLSDICESEMIREYQKEPA